MRHTKKIKSCDIGNEQLAEEIGDLYYDSLEEFLTFLSNKLEKDSITDSERERQILAFHLKQASILIEQASKHISAAWDISSPFVKE